METRRTSSLAERRTAPRAATFIGTFLLLVFFMACGLLPGSDPNPDPTVPAPEVEQEEAQPVATLRPTRTVTPIPSDEPEQVIPIPDFDEILTYAGGGAGPVQCDSYPPEPGGILVEPPEGDDQAVLCVYLAGIQSAAPIRIFLENSDTNSYRETSDLILDRGLNSVHWSTFVDEGTIEGWTQEGNVRIALSIAWPATLDPGTWIITALQAGRTLASGEFQYSRPQGSSYVQVLNDDSPWELTPGNYFDSAQSLHLPEDRGLSVYGDGYPPDVPVYIVLYQQEDVQYSLVQAWAMVANNLGGIYGEIEAPLEAGGRYILYGLTDPDTDLTDLATPDCTDQSSLSPGFACDLFDVVPTIVSSVPYSTQVPLACPGAPPSYIIPGQFASVCTQSDAVNLRDSPSRSAAIERQLDPGTIIEVVSGPECADNWSWWFVTLDDGESGWLAEGGDNIDPYFMCPLP